MNFASIEVTSTILEPTHIRHLSYKWVGKKYWILEADPVTIHKLPFKLVEIKSNTSLYQNSNYYVRADAYLPYGLILRVGYQLQRVWSWLFVRVIATLNIWGIAYTPIGNIPSWSDIGRKR